MAKSTQLVGLIIYVYIYRVSDVLAVKNFVANLRAREQLLNCLDTYGLELEQLYSNTIDNEANIVKASKILQDEQEARILQESDTAVDEEEVLQRIIEFVFSIVICVAHMLQLAADD